MPEAARTRTAKVALALAIASSVVVAAAIVVTLVRSHARTERSRHPRTDKIDTAGALVRAADVLRLQDAVESSGDGIRVHDRALAAALRLRDSDVITALSGRIVRGSTDVTAAVSSMFMLDPSAVYVDLIRDGKPLLLKWQIDGSIRDGLADLHRGVTKTIRGGLAAGMVGGLSAAPGVIDPFATAHAVDPFATAHAVDPFIATITNIDVDHYAMPVSTFRVLFDDPVSQMARGVIATIKCVPSAHGNGSVNRLFGIRPSSVWYALGLRNGDIVLGANGHSVGFSTLFDDTRQLANADTIDLEIERSGANIHLRYDITP
ncbi:MAG TPA: hypothetical protein VGM39_13940, partial [Kofleriaceae bacterium]|jgi:hypothetical protein